MLIAAKVLTLTAVDLLQDPQALQEAKGQDGTLKVWESQTGQ